MGLHAEMLQPDRILDGPIFSCWELIFAHKLKFPVPNRAVGTMVIHFHCMDAAIVCSADERVSIFNKSQCLHFGFGGMSVCLTRSWGKVLFQAGGVPNLDGAVVRGSNKESMVWRHNHTVDRSAVLPENGDKTPRRFPDLVRFKTVGFHNRSSCIYLFDIRSKVKEVGRVVFRKHRIQQPEDDRIVTRIRVIGVEFGGLERSCFPVERAGGRGWGYLCPLRWYVNFAKGVSRACAGFGICFGGILAVE